MKSSIADHVQWEKEQELPTFREVNIGKIRRLEGSYALITQQVKHRDKHYMRAFELKK